MYYDIRAFIARITARQTVTDNQSGITFTDLFGTGPLGTVTQTTNASFSGGDFIAWILPAGNTVTATPDLPIIIRATTSITIAGTITADNKITTASEGGLYIGTPVASYGGNGGNGGSQSGESATTHYGLGQGSLTNPSTYPFYAPGLGFGLPTLDSVAGQPSNITANGFTGLSTASTQANGAQVSAAAFTARLRSRATMALMIIGGAPGAAGLAGGPGGMGGGQLTNSGGTGGAGGAGGNGGASIILIAPTITFAATAVLTSLGGAGVAGSVGGNGNNGAAGTGGGGGGGSGGGGQGGSGGLIFAYGAKITNAGATTTVTGGNNGAAGATGGVAGTNGGGAGGNGGNGGVGSAGVLGTNGFVSIANII